MAIAVAIMAPPASVAGTTAPQDSMVTAELPVSTAIVAAQASTARQAADTTAAALVVVDTTVVASAAVEVDSTAAAVAEGSMVVVADTAVVVDTANTEPHEQKARSNERAFFLPIRSAMPHSDPPA